MPDSNPQVREAMVEQVARQQYEIKWPDGHPWEDLTAAVKQRYLHDASRLSAALSPPDEQAVERCRRAINERIQEYVLLHASEGKPDAEEEIVRVVLRAYLNSDDGEGDG